MFGDNMLVHPIVTKLDPLTNLTAHHLYLPMFEGPDAVSMAWVERSSGRCFTGGEGVHDGSIGYRLSETAEFIRPGSMVPMVSTPSAQWNADEYANTSAVCPTLTSDGKQMKPPPAALLGAASRVPCAIEWHVYLGNASCGSGELLEDDGRSTAYLGGEDFIVITNATYKLDGAVMLVEVGPQVGNYSGSPFARWVTVVVHNVLAPVSAKSLFPSGGKDLIGDVSWDAASLTATVELGAVTAAKGASFQLSWADSPISELLCRSGRTGWPRLNQRLMDVKREIDWEGSRPVQAEPSMLLNKLASTATRMQEAPVRTSPIPTTPRFLRTFSERLLVFPAHRC